MTPKQPETGDEANPPATLRGDGNSHRCQACGAAFASATALLDHDCPAERDED